MPPRNPLTATRLVSLTGDRPLPRREARKLKEWWSFCCAAMKKADGRRDLYHVTAIFPCREETADDQDR